MNTVQSGKQISSIYITQFAQHLNRFVKTSIEETESILSFFNYKKLKKNDVVIDINKPVQETYFVLNGVLISKYVDESGKEHAIQFAIENCWITDQAAYYNRTHARLKVIALSNAEVLSLSFDDRERLCNEYHVMEAFFRKKGNDSFVKQQERLLTYLTENAQERFNLLMKEYPTLFQRVSKRIIAQYLGVSRETLSRLGK